MKSVLSVLLIISFISLRAQDISVVVSAGNKSVAAKSGDENDDKTLIINKAQNGYLIINVTTYDTAWKKDFFIVDDTGNVVLTTVLMKTNEYCTTIKNLVKFLQTSKNYFLYVGLIPKDIERAMLVRVAKKLICKIRMDN